MASGCTAESSIAPGLEDVGVGRPQRHTHPELPARYILFVGNRTQYKDAGVLMRAFAQAARHERDIVKGEGLAKFPWNHGAV